MSQARARRFLREAAASRGSCGAQVLSDDVQRAITNAREELVRRMNDPDEIRKIPPLTLVRVADFLAGQSRGSGLSLPPPSPASSLAFVRALGLPDVRQAELLAHLLGVTAEEAATMLGETAEKEE